VPDDRPFDNRRARSSFLPVRRSKFAPVRPIPFDGPVAARSGASRRHQLNNKPAATLAPPSLSGSLLEEEKTPRRKKHTLVHTLFERRQSPFSCVSRTSHPNYGLVSFPHIRSRLQKSDGCCHIPTDLSWVRARRPFLASSLSRFQVPTYRDRRESSSVTILRPKTCTRSATSSSGQRSVSTSSKPYRVGPARMIRESRQPQRTETAPFVEPRARVVDRPESTSGELSWRQSRVKAIRPKILNDRPATRARKRLVLVVDPGRAAGIVSLRGFETGGREAPLGARSFPKKYSERHDHHRQGGANLTRVPAAFSVWRSRKKAIDVDAPDSHFSEHVVGGSGFTQNPSEG